MALHLLRLVNHWFTLAAFWGYLAAFALAFTMVIVFFPVGALLLLFIGIFTLPVVVCISLLLGAWERAWCRRWLRAARCPMCRSMESIERVGPIEDGLNVTLADALEASRRNPDDPASYECGRCGAFFAASGEGVEPPLAAAA